MSSLTVFAGKTLCLASLLFRITFQSPVSRFKMQPMVTHLVKTEIVSSYHGIFINTGLGNPTCRPHDPLGIGEFKARGGRSIFTAFIRR